jgi:hypothetical protein
MRRFPSLAIGTRRARLRTAARGAATAVSRIRAVWGFGSALRAGSFNDVDLLLVLVRRPQTLVEDANRAARKLKTCCPRWGVPVHVLVVTEREMLDQPLRDMHLLEPLFMRRRGRVNSGPPFGPRSNPSRVKRVGRSSARRRCP